MNGAKRRKLADGGVERVQSWSQSDVLSWIEGDSFRAAILGQYRQALIDSDVCDGQQLLELTPEDLEREIGISNACHRLFIEAELDTLRGNVPYGDEALEWQWEKVREWLQSVGQLQRFEKNLEQNGIVNGQVMFKLLSLPSEACHACLASVGMDKAPSRRLFIREATKLFSTLSTPVPVLHLNSGEVQSELSQPSSMVTGPSSPIATSLDEDSMDLSRIVMMHASPLVMYTSDPKDPKQPLQLLDLEAEARALLEIRRETPTDAVLDFVTATIDSFQQALSHECSVLHLSGHGMSAVGSEPRLLFENANGDGSAQVITVDTLSTLLGPNKESLTLKCVVLSTCFSEAFSSAFLSAGVMCVIGTKEKVVDKVAETFNKTFYSYVLRHTHPRKGQVLSVFKKAFDMACARVKVISANDARNFQFFQSRESAETGMTSLSLEGASPCISAASTPVATPVSQAIVIQGVGVAASWSNQLLTPNPRPMHQSRLPAMVDHFLGRQIDMHEILKGILGHRLVTIKGCVGVGKTALARAVALHMDKRKHWRSQFIDGMYFVELQGVTTEEAITKRVFDAMKRQKNGPGLPWLIPELVCCDLSTLLHHLTNARLLVFLDGCDDAFEILPGLLSKFLDECHELKFVCTSRRMTPQPQGHVNFTHALEVLSEKDAKRLLVKLCQRSIPEEEFQAAHKQGKFQALMQKLSQHPATIDIAAQMLRKKTLLEVLDELEKPLHHATMSDAGFSQLFVTLDAAFSQLPSSAQSLYVLLAMLPSGADPELLNHVCGQDTWRGPMDTLVDESIAVMIRDHENTSGTPGGRIFSQTELYRLGFSYIITCANRKAFDRTEWHTAICAHMAKQSRAAHAAWMGPNNESSIAWLTLHERNLWCCLHDALAHAGNPKLRELDSYKDYVDAVSVITRHFAEMLRMSERKADANTSIQLGLEISRKHRFQLGEARCHLVASKNWAEQRRINESRENLLRALVLFSRTGNTQGYHEALWMVAKQKVQVGWRPREDYDAQILSSTLKLIEDSMIAEMDGEEDVGVESPQQVTSGRELSHHCALVAEVVQNPPMDIVNQLLNEGIQDQRLEAECLLLKGEVKYLEHSSTNVADAENLFQMARKKFKSVNDVFGQAEATKHLAQLELKRNNQKLAWSLLNECFEFYKSCQLLVSQTNIVRLIGEIKFGEAKDLYEAREYEKSLECAKIAENKLRVARNYFQKLGRKHGEVASLRLLGELYDWIATSPPLKGSTEQEAIQCLKLALDCTEAKPTPPGIRLRLKASLKLLDILTRSSSAEYVKEANAVFELAQQILSETTDADQTVFRPKLEQARQKLENSKTQRLTDSFLVNM
eukprot:c11412_g1_i1.p1 GENE.c11412_g1_i1~~c11412_g1_i1.p1  ORF type:complete len:1357 (-),score=330.09 c11412_g1_i1:29-4060(-)